MYSEALGVYIIECKHEFGNEPECKHCGEYGPEGEGVTTSKQTEKRPLVGIGVIVWKDDKILLGKRLVPHGNGYYSLPGGHVEYKEKVVDCAIRELKEETGLEIEHPVLAGYTDDFHPDSGKHYVTIYIEGDYKSGVLENLEPQKCEGWDWYSIKDLPNPLWEPLKKLFKEGRYGY